MNIHLVEMKGSFCVGYVNGEGGRARGWFWSSDELRSVVSKMRSSQ